MRWITVTESRVGRNRILDQLTNELAAKSSSLRAKNVAEILHPATFVRPDPQDSEDV